MQYCTYDMGRLPRTLSIVCENNTRRAMLAAVEDKARPRVEHKKSHRLTPFEELQVFSWLVQCFLLLLLGAGRQSGSKPTAVS